MHAYAHWPPMVRRSSRRRLDALEEHSGAVLGCGNKPTRVDGNTSQIEGLKRVVTVEDAAAAGEELQEAPRIAHEHHVAAAAYKNVVAGAAGAARFVAAAVDGSMLAEAGDFRKEVQQVAVGTERAEMVFEFAAQG